MLSGSQWALETTVSVVGLSSRPMLEFDSVNNVRKSHLCGLMCCAAVRGVAVDSRYCCQQMVHSATSTSDIRLERPWPTLTPCFLWLRQLFLSQQLKLSQCNWKMQCRGERHKFLLCGQQRKRRRPDGFHGWDPRTNSALDTANQA